MTLQKKLRHRSVGKALAVEDPWMLARKDKGEERRGGIFLSLVGLTKLDLKIESSAQRGISCALYAARREMTRGGR